MSRTPRREALLRATRLRRLGRRTQALNLVRATPGTQSSMAEVGDVRAVHRRCAPWRLPRDQHGRSSAPPPGMRTVAGATAMSNDCTDPDRPTSNFPLTISLAEDGTISVSNEDQDGVCVNDTLTFTCASHPWAVRFIGMGKPKNQNRKTPPLSARPGQPTDFPPPRKRPPVNPTRTHTPAPARSRSRPSYAYAAIPPPAPTARRTSAPSPETDPHPEASSGTPPPPCSSAAPHSPASHPR
jgi:hypothetical protein